MKVPLLGGSTTAAVAATRRAAFFHSYLTAILLVSSSRFKHTLSLSFVNKNSLQTTRTANNNKHRSTPTTTNRSRRQSGGRMPFAAAAAAASNAESSAASPPGNLRFCDIGANLLDERFTTGTYRGTYRHEPDLDLVVQRAVHAGVQRILLTAGTVAESREAVHFAREWNKNNNNNNGGIRFACTVGVHPTRCSQVFEGMGSSVEAAADGNSDSSSNNKNISNVDPDQLLDELLEICRDGMTDGTVVAIGEIGLDYDRLDFCPAAVQKKYLVLQLERLAAPTGLPLFLHNRSVGDDLYNILVEYNRNKQRDTNGSRNVRGVVHSFDDSTELAMKFIDDLGLYIGLNGCSLRTEENLTTAVKLPLGSILLETDCPYCEVRPTHAGYKHIATHFPSKAEKKFERGQCVKSRQEPCHIVQVAEIVAGAKSAAAAAGGGDSMARVVSVQTVADACYENSLRLFGWSSDYDDDEAVSTS